MYTQEYFELDELKFLACVQYIEDRYRSNIYLQAVTANIPEKTNDQLNINRTEFAMSFLN